MLDREEYIEQAFFFEMFLERLDADIATQEILRAAKNELLGTTMLPKAVEFLLTDLKYTGTLSHAMSLIPHYFTPFQTYVVAQSEKERGGFDFRTALKILHAEAKYRTDDKMSIQGLFFYQLETLCRNKLGYDFGLAAIAADPAYNEDWKAWIEKVRMQLGLIDLAEMICVRSSYYKKKPGEEAVPVLFGEQEGRIAWATRRKDPVFLFSALSRHLNYPAVPRLKRAQGEENEIPLLKRLIVQLEQRLMLLEEELRGGININRYFVQK